MLFLIEMVSLWNFIVGQWIWLFFLWWTDTVNVLLLLVSNLIFSYHRNCFTVVSILAWSVDIFRNKYGIICLLLKCNADNFLPWLYAHPSFPPTSSIMSLATCLPKESERSTIIDTGTGHRDYDVFTSETTIPFSSQYLSSICLNIPWRFWMNHKVNFWFIYITI